MIIGGCSLGAGITAGGAKPGGGRTAGSPANR